MVPDLAAEGLNDGCDDREPQAGPAAVPRATGIRPVEAVEHARRMLRRDSWPVVDDAQLRITAVSAEDDLDWRRRGRVDADVRQQVADHLADPVLVPTDGHRVAQQLGDR